jgi:modulator of FtsH protease HflK
MLTCDLTQKDRQMKKIQYIILLSIFLIYGGLNSFYKIDPSQQGVVVRLGAFSHISEEGPHFKIPFIDRVYKIAVTRIHEMRFGFDKQSESQEKGRLESLMLTGDLNVAIVEWVLQYRITNPKKFIFHAENVEKNIRDTSMSVMRRVVGDKLVSDVLTTDRISIANEARKITQEVLDKFDMGILITQLNLRNVTPPEEVKAAFNEINIAKQEREQMINHAKEAYNKAIPEAQGKAKKFISKAEAYAVETINKAEGESSRFKQMLIAYKEHPKITKTRMYLEVMEEVLAKIDSLIVIDSELKNVLPVLGMKGEVK